MESFDDLEIVCLVCGKIFIYTQGERAFMEGLKNSGQIKEIVVPKRCKECRTPEAKKKQLKTKGAAIAAEKDRKTASEPKAASSGLVFTITSADLHKEVMRCEGRIPDHDLVEEVVHAPFYPIKPGATAMPSMPGKTADAKDVKDVKPELPPFNLPISQDQNKPDEALRCVLVAGDFEKLVCRQEVTIRQGNRKVVLILADIGPQAMKDAMKKAVLSWWGS